MRKNPRLIFNTLLTMLVLLGAGKAVADMVVIVHPANDNAITQAFLQKLYLGKTQRFTDGSPATPLDLEAGEPIREVFLTLAVDMKPVQYRRYWSKALFTGGGEPPREVANQRDVVGLVANQPEMVGYIDAQYLTDEVKAVLRVRR